MGRLRARCDFAGMFEREFVFEIPNGIVVLWYVLHYDGVCLYFGNKWLG
jgi:hypothetical protein